MGNSRSRHRTEAPTPQPQNSGTLPTTYPSQTYRPGAPQPQPGQGGPYYGNNGQFYGNQPSQTMSQQYYHYSHQRPPQTNPPSRRPSHQGATAAAPSNNKPTQQVTQTATIRNAVNVRKDTLKVTPMPGDPTKLLISFSFDASSPCAVGTYVAATEIPSRGCALVPKHQTPPPLVVYPKGMNQNFPPTTEDGTTQVQHVIDVSLHTETELCSSSTTNTNTKESTYPLIIRLESITEEGYKAGHTLEELKPGGEQAGWVQSQTTFVELHKEDDHNGAYVVRILKQKIWVQGTSYELQEIYGLQQGSRNSKKSSSSGLHGDGSSQDGTTTTTASALAGMLGEDEERLCVICLVNDRDTTVLPCRHMCMCHECAQELRKQTSKCPICRKEVESLLHIKLNRSRSGGGTTTSSKRAAAAAATV